MSNNYTPGSNSGTPSNTNSSASRRETRASNVTGALAALGPMTERIGERGQYATFDFEQMLVSLRELFEHDRQVASQQDATRCGICYLHFAVSELHYRDDGYYVCKSCEHNAGRQNISMLRRQQKM